MSLTISISPNEVTTMVRIVEEFLKEIRLNNEKLASNETEKKARNAQLDQFVYNAINEVIAKNNTYRMKNPSANMDGLFDMQFSKGNAEIYKDSITAFLNQVKNTEIEDTHPEYIARSKRVLEAFENSISDQ